MGCLLVAVIRTLGQHLLEDAIQLGWAIWSLALERRYRIAHMGHVNAHMTLGVLAVMESGMRALGLPHGAGALDAAAAAIAEAAGRGAVCPPPR